MATTSSKVVAEEENRGAPIHGDILEAIFSHVPLVDLVAASHVSRAWKRAVSSSLRNSNNRLKPWLVVHRQSTRSPYVTTTHAYDPRSRVWIDVKHPRTECFSAALRSSHSSLLFMLSSSSLSFSVDPLHLTWHHAIGPRTWRTDPIVALVGRNIVVAGGGACGLDGESPLAVELYDVESREWDSCESMPSVLEESAASTWLSVATDNNKLFLAEKYSGVTHTFDPKIKAWYGPYDLRPDPEIFYSVITIANDRLILIGLIGDAENLKGLKLWEVNCETFVCEEIGEMPMSLIEKLRGEEIEVSSINVCSVENILYIYNPSEIEELFVCELVDGGGCVWLESIRNMASGDRNWSERFVMTCSKVGMDDLRKAVRSENRRLAAVIDRDG